MLHATLAVNGEGTPLGLLAAQSWARNPAEFGKAEKRHRLPIEQKESYKWLASFKAATATAAACPDTTVVSVGDREADIYDLFALAHQTPNAPLLLVRAQHDRKLLEEQGRLSDQLTNVPESGVQEIMIPRKGNRPQRIARLAIRHSKVVLALPSRKKEQGAPLTVWVILAEEKDPPEGFEPLTWVLLTTAQTETFAQACEHLSWYARRWTIEVFHRTLKSGCRIENRQLGSASRLAWITEAG